MTEFATKVSEATKKNIFFELKQQKLDPGGVLTDGPMTEVTLRKMRLDIKTEKIKKVKTKKVQMQESEVHDKVFRDRTVRLSSCPVERQSSKNFKMLFKCKDLMQN